MNLVKISQKPQTEDGISISRTDLKEFLSCLYALLWLEQPEGIIFQHKARNLIEKYQPDL